MKNSLSNSKEQKAINIWQSLNSVGVGFSSYGSTLAADVKLLSCYVNHPFVYGCAELNANTISAIPFTVYQIQKKGTTVSKSVKGRKLKRKEVKKLNRFRKSSLADDAEVVALSEHDIYDMLNTDAEDLRGVNIIKATQLYLEILGRAYWLKERSAIDDETVISVRVLRSEFVTPNVDAEGIVLDYYYLSYVDGKINQTKLDKEDIIDFRNPALTNLYAGGQSWVRAAYQQIAASSKWFEHINRLLDNNARPDYIASPVDGEMDPDVLKREQEKFLQKVKSNNNGAPIFLEKSYKITPLFFQATDLAGLQISNEAKKDIALAAGIPGPLVGVEDKTYNTYETALEDYARRAQLPRCRNLEDVFNARLVPLFGDDVFIEFDNPVPEDLEFELEQDKVAVQKAQVIADTGSGTPNEIRTLLGLDASDEAGMDDLIKPTAAPSKPGTVPTDEAAEAEGEAPKATPDAAESQPDGKEGAEDGKAEDKAFGRLLKLNRDVAKGAIPRAIAINIAERLGFCDAKNLVGFAAAEQKSHEGSCWSSSQGDCPCMAKKKAKASQGVNAAGAEQPHAKIQAVCSKFFKDLGAEAIRQTKAYEPQLVTKAVDTGNLPSEFVDLEHWINNLKNKSDDLAHRVKPLIQLTAQEGADGKTEALIKAGADPDAFSVVPQNVSKAADKRSFRFAQSTLDTTAKTAQDAIDAVKQKIEDGVLEGDSVDELRKAISEVFEDASDYQAERIARTEASAAVHSGQVMSAKASGIVKGFKYLVSEDACPVCQDYDGEEIDLDDYDDSGAVDATDAVPLHPNCTCTLTEVLDLGDEGESN